MAQDTRMTGRPGLSMFSLKLFAMLAMLASHVSIVFADSFSAGTYSALYYFGRMSFPIFAFSIANGWGHTRSKMMYMLRLFIMALVSQVPFAVALYGRSPFDLRTIFFDTTLNIGCTFVIAALGLMLYDFFRRASLPVALALTLGTIPTFIVELVLGAHTDYGYKGVILILIMYAIKQRPLKLLSSAVVLIWICASRSALLLTVRLDAAFFMVLSLLILTLYNGKRGSGAKYLFYVFYPLHLVILILLKMYI